MSKQIESIDILGHEAVVFGKYLLRQAPNEKVVELYRRAMSTTIVKPTPEDQKLLDFISKHTWSVGLIDGGLALLNTDSDVRRRIYTMLAITEAMPDYYDYYLPKKRSNWYLLSVAFVGIRGVLRTVFGAIVIKVIA
jgi:hypothetical protein